MSSYRICMLGARTLRLAQLSRVRGTAMLYCTDRSSSLSPGLKRQAELKLEDLPHLNPGPPTTYDEVAIPFKPLAEAKKEFMPTFNMYFYGSLALFIVTAYIAIFVEEVFPFTLIEPVKSYRDRHKAKSVDASNAQAAQSGSAVASSGKSSTGPPPPAAAALVAATQDLNKIPESITYLLIGSGTASYYASLAIRARDANARVLIVGNEAHLPYNRPPLSKELWWYGDENVAENLEYKGYSGRKRDIFFEAPGFFVAPGEVESSEYGGIALVTSRFVVKLDVPAHVAYLDDGSKIKYEKCLIATGGQPRNLPIIESAGFDVKNKVTLFKTIDDFRKLDAIAKAGGSITIIGGGLLGTELANSLSKRYNEKGLKVNQIIDGKGNVAEILPEFLSVHVANELRKSGVNVLTENEVRRVSVDDKSDRLRLYLSSGETINTDHLVVAVGTDVYTGIGKSSGLEIDPNNGGYIVDAELRARSDVWVAGDASSFYDVKLGRRRVEHWEHAQITGRLAGENMTGASKPYWHQSSYYSTLAPSVHFEAVGRTDSDLRTVSVLAEEKSGKTDEITKGVVFYLDGRIIVGVLLLNVFGPGIDVARRLISDGQEHEDFKEVAKLFDLHKNNARKEEAES